MENFIIVVGIATAIFIVIESFIAVVSYDPEPVMRDVFVIYIVILLIIAIINFHDSIIQEIQNTEIQEVQTQEKRHWQ